MATQKRKSLLIPILIWTLVAAAAVGAGAYFYMQEPVIEVTAGKVERCMVEETISSIASGTVMPKERSMVAAASIGTIAKVLVEEGDKVNEGDLLVELDHDEVDAQLALTQANLKVGLSRLEQARIAAKIYEEISATRVSQAAAQLDQMQLDFNRVKELSEKKAVSQSDFEKVTLAVRVARETKAAAEASQKENLVRAEEIRSAEAAIEQLEAAVRVAEAARERSMVRAPFTGVIAKKILQVGEAVAMGLPLLQMVRAEDCYIEAPFDEANAAQIHLGQPVRLNLDPYPGETFKGEISYIAPVVTVNKELTRTLDVKVRILEQQEKFVPGMSADVTIIVQQKDNVLAVPSESLVRDEFAYVIENGHAVHHDVKLGIGNWERQEVLEGLEEGQTIITSVAIKALKNGSKVRVVTELGSGG